MGFWEHYGDWLIIAGLAVVAVWLARWVLSGGLRQSRRKARATATEGRLDTNSTVDRLTAKLGSTGEGLQIVHHGSDGEGVDLTDEDLQRGVDGVLRKRGPISQHSVLWPVDVVDRKEN